MKLYTLIIPIFMVFAYAFTVQTAYKASENGTVKITKERLLNALEPIESANKKYND